MSRDINLDTHIVDVVNVFKWEDLKDAVLVGHSYGGWVISGAVEQVLPRVASIVFLDAYMPDNGTRGLDNTSEFSRKGILAAIEKGEISRPSPTAAMFEVNEKDRAWVDSKVTPQPVGVALQPIRLTGARDRVAKKTYIRAASYPQATFDKYLAVCKADRTWRTFEIPCGHDVMVDMPERGFDGSGVMLLVPSPSRYPTTGANNSSAPIRRLVNPCSCRYRHRVSIALRFAPSP